MIGAAADPATPESERDVAFTNWNLDGDRSYGSKTWKADEIVLPDDVAQEAAVKGEEPI